MRKSQQKSITNLSKGSSQNAFFNLIRTVFDEATIFFPVIRCLLFVTSLTNRFEIAVIMCATVCAWNDVIDRINRRRNTIALAWLTQMVITPPYQFNYTVPIIT